MIPPALDDLEDSSPAPINKTPQSPGRPVGTKEIKQKAAAETYNRKDVQQTVKEIEKFRTFVTAEVKDKFKIKRISKQKKELVDTLCENVVIASDKKDWENQAKECINDFDKIAGLSVMPKINEIAAEHQIKLYEASLLYHSNK